MREEQDRGKDGTQICTEERWSNVSHWERPGTEPSLTALRGDQSCWHLKCGLAVKYVNLLFSFSWEVTESYNLCSDFQCLEPYAFHRSIKKAGYLSFWVLKSWTHSII